MPKVRWVLSYGFVANFIRFPAVQKFWKSVKIWQSYGEFKSGNFFETQCRSVAASWWRYDVTTKTMLSARWLCAVVGAEFFCDSGRRFDGGLLHVSDADRQSFFPLCCGYMWNKIISKSFQLSSTSVWSNFISAPGNMPKIISEASPHVYFPTC